MCVLVRRTEKGCHLIEADVSRVEQLLKGNGRTSISVETIDVEPTYFIEMKK